MQTPLRQQRLAALRDVIADIERKPALAEGSARLDEGVSNQAFPRLPKGLVQEVFADENRDAGLSLGFALGQSTGLVTPRRPSIFYIQLAADAQTFGLPYGPGLSWFGLEPARLTMVRVADMTEFLWAAEEVISCRSVSSIIADVRGEPKLLNFTASRRLSLRASASGVSMFLLRYGHGRESSASHLRWRLLPQKSGRHLFDERGLGAARWRLLLEKGRIAGNQVEWLLEWTKNGFALVSPSAKTSTPRATTAFPGALSAPLADRLSQAG